MLVNSISQINKDLFLEKKTNILLKDYYFSLKLEYLFRRLVTVILELLSALALVFEIQFSKGRELLNGVVFLNYLKFDVLYLKVIK